MLVNTEKMFKLYTSLLEHEKESLTCVEHILSFLQDLLEAENVEEISSVDTGDVVDIENIARARDILDGLLHSEEWEATHY